MFLDGVSHVSPSIGSLHVPGVLLRRKERCWLRLGDWERWENSGDRLV
jgi:hypothetical protein